MTLNFLDTKIAQGKEEEINFDSLAQIAQFCNLIWS